MTSRGCFGQNPTDVPGHPCTRAHHQSSPRAPRGFRKFFLASFLVLGIALGRSPSGAWVSVRRLTCDADGATHDAVTGYTRHIKVTVWYLVRSRRRTRSAHSSQCALAVYYSCLSFSHSHSLTNDTLTSSATVSQHSMINRTRRSHTATAPRLLDP